MRTFIPAFMAVLATACTAPQAWSAPIRDVTLAVPPGCRLEGARENEHCTFTTPAGRLRTLEVTSGEGPFDDFDRPEALRAQMRQDPQRFWPGVVVTWQALHDAEGSPGVRSRRTGARAFPPPPGAEACLWFTYDASGVETGLTGDVQVLRCALYDPASDRVEEFKLAYMEVRTPGMASNPGFAADAERLFRSLRFAPPGGVPPSVTSRKSK